MVVGGESGRRENGCVGACKELLPQDRRDFDWVDMEEDSARPLFEQLNVFSVLQVKDLLQRSRHLFQATDQRIGFAREAALVLDVVVEGLK